MQTDNFRHVFSNGRRGQSRRVFVRLHRSSHYRRLLEAGIAIYEYLPGLLHAKTITMDGTVTLVGSTNLDLRSFDLNFQNNIIFYDDAITRDMADRQQVHQQSSLKITLSEVQQWPMGQRLWHKAVATVGPIL